MFHDCYDELRQDALVVLSKIKSLLLVFCPGTSESKGSKLQQHTKSFEIMATHPLMQTSVFLRIAKMSYVPYFSVADTSVTAVLSKASRRLPEFVTKSPLVGRKFWLKLKYYNPLHSSLSLYYPQGREQSDSQKLDSKTCEPKLKHLQTLLGIDPRLASCFITNFEENEFYAHETLLSVCVRNPGIPMSFKVDLFELGSRIHPLLYFGMMKESEPKVTETVKSFEAEIVRRAQIRGPAYLESISEPRLSAKNDWSSDKYMMPSYIEPKFVKDVLPSEESTRLLSLLSLFDRL